MSQLIDDPQVIYIFKSTYYLDFRQKILSLLSLPNDMLITIEYDEKWLATNIKENIKNLKGKMACLIFLDYSSRKPRFFPLRICMVNDTVTPTDGVTYQFILNPNNFISPIDSKEFDTRVYKFLQEKNLIEKDSQGNETISNLIVSGDKTILDMTIKGDSQQNIWIKIVKELAEANDVKRLENQSQFRESTFFRLNILPRGELGSPLIPTKHAFRFKQGEKYSVVISVYQPNFKNFQKDENRKLVMDFDSKLISHVGSTDISLPLRQRKYTKYFDLQVKEPIISGESLLAVHGEDDDFNIPSVRLPYVLTSKKETIIGVVFTLGIGIFILGATGLLADVLVSIFDANLTDLLFRTRAEFILTGIGTILSALPIAWLEFKRRIS